MTLRQSYRICCHISREVCVVLRSSTCVVAESSRYGWTLTILSRPFSMTLSIAVTATRLAGGLVMTFVLMKQLHIHRLYIFSCSNNSSKPLYVSVRLAHGCYLSLRVCSGIRAPCGLVPGWKNRAAPYPGRLSCKNATKPGSVCPLLA